MITTQGMAAHEFATIPAGTAPLKLAQRVAARLEQEIIRLGWPVGHNLGSEADLAQRLGVGRWVLREAIRIAVGDGLLEIRRGRTGGLLVAAPAEDAVVVALHNYLEFCQPDLDDLLHARFVIETLALQLAARRINGEDCAALRAGAEAAVGEPATYLAGGFLRDILRHAGNRVVSVYALALAAATRALVPSQGVKLAAAKRQRKALAELRRAQIEAVIAADMPRIHQLQGQYLERCRTLLASGSETGDTGLDGSLTADTADLKRPNSPRRSDLVSRRLLARIAALGLPAGHNLGSEAELMAALGVSRAVLREAIRPLERHGVVHMRRGRGRHSGLLVGEPDPSATVRSAVLFLKYSQVPLRDIFEVQEAVEHAVAAAAAGLPREAREALGDRLLVLAGGERPGSVAAVEAYMWNFYLELGTGCGNPVLGLMARVLLDMSGYLTEATASPAVSAELVDANCGACRDLAESIRSGDQAMARRNFLLWRRIALRMLPRARPLEQILTRELLWGGSLADEGLTAVTTPDGAP